MSGIPLKSNAGVKHGRGKEKGEEVGEVAPGDPTGSHYYRSDSRGIDSRWPDPIVISHVDTLVAQAEIKKMPSKRNVRARNFRVDFH